MSLSKSKPENVCAKRPTFPGFYKAFDKDFQLAEPYPVDRSAGKAFEKLGSTRVVT